MIFFHFFLCFGLFFINLEALYYSGYRINLNGDSHCCDIPSGIVTKWKQHFIPHFPFLQTKTVKQHVGPDGSEQYLHLNWTCWRVVLMDCARWLPGPGRMELDSEPRLRVLLLVTSHRQNPGAVSIKGHPRSSETSQESWSSFIFET